MINEYRIMVYLNLWSIYWSNIKRSRYWMPISIKGAVLRMPDFFCNCAILHSAYFRTQYNAIIKVTSKAWLPSYAVWLKVKGEGRGGCHMQSEAQIICKYLRNLIKKFWFTKRLNVKARIENKHGGPLLSIKETVRVILLDPHAKIAMLDLQWLHWNIYLINNVEDIV